MLSAGLAQALAGGTGVVGFRAAQRLCLLRAEPGFAADRSGPVQVVFCRACQATLPRRKAGSATSWSAGDQKPARSEPPFSSATGCKWPWQQEDSRSDKAHRKGASTAGQERSQPAVAMSSQRSGYQQVITGKAAASAGQSLSLNPNMVVLQVRLFLALTSLKQLPGFPV